MIPQLVRAGSVEPFEVNTAEGRVTVYKPQLRVRGKDIGTSFEVEGEGEQFWVDLSQQGFQKHHWELEDVAAQKSP